MVEKSYAVKKSLSGEKIVFETSKKHYSFRLKAMEITVKCDADANIDSVVKFDNDFRLLAINKHYYVQKGFIQLLGWISVVFSVTEIIFDTGVKGAELLSLPIFYDTLAMVAFGIENMYDVFKGYQPVYTENNMRPYQVGEKI